jgi:hypothetical protein
MEGVMMALWLHEKVFFPVGDAFGGICGCDDRTSGICFKILQKPGTGGSHL